MKLDFIDGGRSFDWGKTSSDYAKYRDIYPEEFYEKILSYGIGLNGQKILDLGTGTGVLPRNMYRFGAEFVGTDISENQICEAKRLSQEQNMNIRFFASPAEDVDFSDGTFDAVTACQCFFYFDHEKLAPKISKILKNHGKLAVLYMAWLPYEDEIAGESEKLILKYNPSWSGCGETRHEIFIPEAYSKCFNVEKSCTFDIDVPFTRESWNGRIMACRGVGASLSSEKTTEFAHEHTEMLEKSFAEKFYVKHYAAISILCKK